MPSSGVQTCARSEEHTSELQSHDNLVCRLLLVKNRGRDGARLGIGRIAPLAAGPMFMIGVGVVVFIVLLRTLRIVPHFFNDTATTEIYTLSLHDALPI